MKLIRRIVSATLVLSLSLCLSACSDKEKTKAPEIIEETTKTPASEEKPSPEDSTYAEDYRSEKYNLVFTLPAEYVMFNNTQIDAQAVGQTKYEMVAEHNSGYPRVMVIAETTDAPDVNAYLENLQTVVSSTDFTMSEISDYEIAGRSFRGFTAERTDGILQSFYAEKCGDEFVCISVSDLKDFPTDESVATSAFSPYAQ